MLNINNITEKKKHCRLVAHMVVEHWTHKKVVAQWSHKKVAAQMAGNMVDMELVEVVLMAGQQLQDQR